MLMTHAGHTPRIDPTAWIAPNAVICGDVTIGPNCRVMYGAQIIAEGSSIQIGQQCIVLENAVLRSTHSHPLRIGDHCMVGPGTHLVGCTVEDQVFIATGAAVFHGAHLEQGCEIRIHAVVHIKTRVPANEHVPIGWVAVGDPAHILPASAHEQIWRHQHPLNFPLTVYGIDRSEADMIKITARMADLLNSHSDDQPA
ncbi:carbonic anhydrase/acetyltransferase-like protein (isoleucine patch superfamily) [Silvimonas terrae]|uniref:Carbonic anhydrase/acetyltransferase-like protein (Isoleucine patch superfamily) n=1 Tax=Silvimonas terrae TaxID=300266 RepID=A0A840RIJ8_9NEIS|nr:gamma carbonic anhydrase family protein [Silvimonas terrae]MBB5193519.1 carbonic anhydrase/acetyltransferase-like protein (isoleucine patch superfamily) [Silvimonas terrae]